MDDFLTFVRGGERKKEAAYLAVAAQLKAKFPAIVDTPDAYGQGAQVYGAAFKAPGNVIEPVAQFLIGLGFRRQKNKLTKTPVVVEMGSSAAETFLYISDDN